MHSNYKKANRALFSIVLSMLLSSCTSTYLARFPETVSYEIRRGDSVIVFEYRNAIKPIKPLNPLLEYFYFDKTTIRSSFGIVRGRLLDGNYCVMDSSLRTIYQGVFKKGLKDGIWYRYHLNGSLKQVKKFKNGSETGWFINFNTNGTISSKSKAKRWFLKSNTTRINKDTVGKHQNARHSNS